jgi:hypothetical protein
VLVLQFLLHDDVTGYLLARIAVQIIVCVCSKLDKQVVAKLDKMCVARLDKQGVAKLDKQGVAKSEAKCNRNRSVDGGGRTQTQKRILVVYFSCKLRYYTFPLRQNNHKNVSLCVVIEVGWTPFFWDMTPPH